MGATGGSRSLPGESQARLDCTLGTHRDKVNEDYEMLTTYYVATLAAYVLVDANDEIEARRLGHDALYDLYSGTRERLGGDSPIVIRTVRPATADDLELSRWHDRQASRHH
jgi:hypothetical protein